MFTLKSKSIYREQMLIGMTKDLYLNKGLTPDEIAEKLHRSVDDVIYWLGIIYVAERNKTTK